MEAALWASADSRRVLLPALTASQAPASACAADWNDSAALACAIDRLAVFFRGEGEIALDGADDLGRRRGQVPDCPQGPAPGLPQPSAERVELLDRRAERLNPPAELKHLRGELPGRFLATRGRLLDLLRRLQDALRERELATGHARDGLRQAVERLGDLAAGTRPAPDPLVEPAPRTPRRPSRYRDTECRITWFQIASTAPAKMPR